MRVLLADRDGRILVANQNNGVLVFAAGSTGNVPPVTSLSVDPTYPYGYNLAIAP